MLVRSIGVGTIKIRVSSPPPPQLPTNALPSPTPPRRGKVDVVLTGGENIGPGDSLLSDRGPRVEDESASAKPRPSTSIPVFVFETSKSVPVPVPASDDAFSHSLEMSFIDIANVLSFIS